MTTKGPSWSQGLQRLQGGSGLFSFFFPFCGLGKVHKIFDLVCFSPYKRMPRGLLKTYKIGSRSYSITQLLDFGGVQEVVSSRSTEGSKRELLRDLRKNVITPQMLTNQGAAGHSTYGSQRRRAGEALRTTGGDFVQGPRLSYDPFYEGPYDPNLPPPMDRRYGRQKSGALRNSKRQVVEGPRKGRNRFGRGTMHFLGVRRSAKEASLFFPRLRKEVDGGKGLKQRTIEAKIRRAYKEGIHQSLLIRQEAVFDRTRQLRGKGKEVVKHYLRRNPDRTLFFRPFLEETATEVICLMDENPGTKVQYTVKAWFRDEKGEEPEKVPQVLSS